MEIMSRDFLILYKFSFRAKVKRRVKISKKHDAYKLPHKLQNDLRLRIIGN